MLYYNQDGKQNHIKQPENSPKMIKGFSRISIHISGTKLYLYHWRAQFDY